MSGRYDFERVHVDVEGAVATLHLQWPDGVSRNPQQHHRELALALRQLRDDDAVRVVVIRGAVDGSFMGPFSGAREDGWRAHAKRGVMSDPDHVFAALRENEQIVNTIIRMEKPVIAMVNGNALGIGASIALACDLIFADEEAFITDIHIANHYFVPGAERSTGIVPGDGGAVFWPAQMGLAKAKEYLLTGRPVRARELADLGAINGAVPRADLMRVVDEYIALLLDRPAWALGWAKVAINKRLRADVELSLDVSAALEALSMRVRDDYPGPKGKQVL